MAFLLRYRYMNHYITDYGDISNKSKDQPDLMSFIIFIHLGPRISYTINIRNFRDVHRQVSPSF